MWARHFELALGLWLLATPYVLRRGGALEATELWGGALLAVLSLASHARRLRRAHLLELPVAGWLAGAGWLATREAATPSAQNLVVVGLLVAMLAVVPSQAGDPPPPPAVPPRETPRAPPA